MFPVSDSNVIRRSRPFVNLTVIGLCIAVFAYELAMAPTARAVFFYRLGLIPAELGQGANYISLLAGSRTFDVASPIPNWATVITSMFIHGSWMHIAGNMLFLWVFGRNVEDRFGHFKYLLFYLAAGAAAAALHTIVNTASQIPTVGASGAIAGVLGAYLVLFPTSRIGTVVFIFVIGFFRIPAVLLLLVWFLLQLVSGVGSLASSAQTGGVAYWAHIGGFVFGVAAALIHRLIPRGRPRPPRSQGTITLDAPTGASGTHYWRGRPV